MDGISSPPSHRMLGCSCLALFFCGVYAPRFLWPPALRPAASLPGDDANALNGRGARGFGRWARRLPGRELQRRELCWLLFGGWYLRAWHFSRSVRTWRCCLHGLLGVHEAALRRVGRRRWGLRRWDHIQGRRVRLRRSLWRPRVQRGDPVVRGSAKLHD